MLAHYNLYAAQAFWATQTPEERQTIITALEGAAEMVTHDFAALPPQIQNGIFAGLTPPEADSESAHAASSSSSRRRKSDD